MYYYIIFEIATFKLLNYEVNYLTLQYIADILVFIASRAPMSGCSIDVVIGQTRSRGGVLHLI